MKRKLVIAAAVVVLVGVGGWGTVRLLRGPSGATEPYGGSLAASVVPDLPSKEADAWANGEPLTLAESRGQPVMIEVWSPG